MVVLGVLLVDLLVNVELDGVISGCDCFHIEVDVLGLLESLHVIEVDNGEEVDEHGSASSGQSEQLSLVHVASSLWENAWSLDVEECIFATFSIGLECASEDRIWVQIQGATLLAFAIVCELLLNVFAVQKSGAISLVFKFS